MPSEPGRSAAWPGRWLAGQSPWDALSVALGATLAIVMVVTLDSYGHTYDEPVHVRYGDLVLRYFMTLGEDDRALRFSQHYGAGFDLFAAVVRRLVPLPGYGATHLACLTVALLSCVGVHRLGRFLGGPSAGFWALAALALTPVYYGHSFNNMKDIPFAAGYVWALYFGCRLLSALPRPRWQDFAWAGIGIGLAACTRMGGFVLVPLIAAVVLVDQLARLRAAEGWRRTFAPTPRLLAGGMGMTLLAWTVMTAPWPFAIENPLGGPASAGRRFANYKFYTSTTLFGGERIPSSEVPWDYIPTYLALQLPEWVTLSAMAVAIGTLAAWLATFATKRPASRAVLLVVASVAGPPLAATVMGSTIYDGLRHFLFIVPPVAVLAGMGAAKAIDLVAHRSRWLSRAVIAVLALLCADQAWAMERMHPYQHVHFNRLAGGVSAAVGRYETEYYGASYKALLGWLVDYVRKRDGEAYMSRIYKVTGCGDHSFFEDNLPENFIYTSRRAARKADFYATYRRFDCHLQHKGYPVIFEIERDDAVLALVRDMKQAPKRKSRRRRRGKRKRPKSP